ncbi:hypothetical protein ScPMuIL_001844 [Solemya velum]
MTIHFLLMKQKHQDSPDNHCVVKNLTTYNNFLFGDVVTNGSHHVANTNSVLHFLTSNGQQQYIGNQTTIEGIPVDHWRSCMYMASMNANYTLDYYFTTRTDNDPLAYPQIPIRAEAKGLRRLSNGTNIQFNHIYEFYDYRPAVTEDATIFLTPKGVVCPGRKKTRPLPKLQKFYSYREEAITGNVATLYDIWYTTAQNLSRLDFRPGQGNTNPVTQIHDYNTGVAYVIDKVFGNCTTMPIPTSSFDAKTGLKTVADPGVLMMRSGASFLYLDDTYTYEGQRPVRGIWCDVFISNRTDYAPIGNKPSRFEFYFLSHAWYQINNIGYTDQVDTDIPIQLDIIWMRGFDEQHVTYNFYNFNQEQPADDVFDISPCYSDPETMSFRIDFPGSYSSMLAFQTFYRSVVSSGVAQYAGISPLRIQKSKFRFSYNDAYFIGVMLERAPPVSEYRAFQGKYMGTNMDAIFNGVTDANECANRCRESQNFTCNGFDICQTKSTCMLSRYRWENKPIGTNPNCVHYSRVIGGLPMNQKSLADAWVQLKNKVLRGELQFEIQMNGQPQTITATSINSNVLVSGNRQLSSSQYIAQFTSYRNQFVPQHDSLTITGTSVDDCAQACVEGAIFVCNSFEYSFDTGSCALSKLQPDVKRNLIQPRSQTDLYIRDYTNQFSKTSGQTALSSANVIYQSIGNANQCAKLCKNYNEFECKSFDYCAYIGLCYLGRRHILDVPVSSIKSNPMCNHYSRNYVADFSRTPNRVIRQQDNRIVQGVSVQQCAKLCVEEQGFSCASFDFCGNTTACRLSTASLTNDKNTAVASAFCSVYSRRALPSTPPQQSNSSGVYSGGQMAGLALGMIILGIMLTGGFIYFYFKRREADTDMKVAFTRNDYSS